MVLLTAKKGNIVFRKEGGGQRPFGSFPKINRIWSTEAKETMRIMIGRKALNVISLQDGSRKQGGEREQRGLNLPPETKSDILG